jgi:hypothetical protein
MRFPAWSWLDDEVPIPPDDANVRAGWTSRRCRAGGPLLAAVYTTPSGESEVLAIPLVARRPQAAAARAEATAYASPPSDTNDTNGQRAINAAVMTAGEDERCATAASGAVGDPSVQSEPPPARSRRVR